MADEFKTFSSTTAFNVFNFKRCNFGIREVIIVIIAAVLLVLFLVFAGLFAQAESEQNTGVVQPNVSAIVATHYCTSFKCLKTASRALELMNQSVDPCENFHEYACGNYKVVKPVLVDAGRRSVLGDMVIENEDRIISLIEKPISLKHDFASERKLKQFFQSCNDMYIREKNRGLPFLTRVVSELGGWKLLGTWDPNWDLNTALKKVHGDFWVDAIYTVTVGVDWYDNTKRSIEISLGGIGKYMSYRRYNDQYYEKVREDYKKFIRRVGSLLLRDAKEAGLTNNTVTNSSVSEDVLEEFVNDTFTFEAKLATINHEHRYDLYEDMSTVTLSDLTTQTNNVINFVDHMSYMFSTAGVNGNTQVVVAYKEQLQNVTSLIASLPPEERNRILHNYLIWRVADYYVQDLSWEYIHANRELYDDFYDNQEFTGLYRSCFQRAQSYMQHALSTLYVREHFVEESKQTVTDITRNIRLALQTQLDKTPWMDETTRKYARYKLDHMTFKMGYPDWMAHLANVDQIYNDLTVNVSDHFGNVVSAEQLLRAQWNQELLNMGDGREEWLYPPYSTVMAVVFYWNEILAPAGILQSPVYHKDQPHHSTFGSLGSILGRYLHHTVDEWGKYYDKNGNFMNYGNGWWSNYSVQAYKPVRQCVYDIYNNVSTTVVYPGGVSRSVRISANTYTPFAISWTNGIRLALIGYNDWVKARGLDEKKLPGIDLTNEQMIFLAHAQTFCFVTGSKSWFLNGAWGRVQEDIQVNMALGQLQEFSDAFNCKAGSKMNHPQKCDYY